MEGGVRLLTVRGTIAYGSGATPRSAAGPCGCPIGFLSIVTPGVRATRFGSPSIDPPENGGGRAAAEIAMRYGAAIDRWSKRS